MQNDITPAAKPICVANVNRVFAMLLLLIAVASLIAAPAVIAETQKPAVPEFTVKLVDSSYDVPAYTSTDPYTGQTLTNPAQHVDNRSLEFTIKNQPFTPYQDTESGFTIKLYYNIRMKGHFGGDWYTLYTADNPHPVQSTSQYTTILLPLEGVPFSSLSSNSSSEVDFQVEAMIGYFSRTTGFASWYFAGEESCWSGTQTLNISPENSPAPTPNMQTASPSPSSSGSSAQLNWWQTTALVLMAAIVVLLGLVVFNLRRRSGLPPS